MIFDDGDEFFLGVAIGVLLGAGVALLLAPDSGRRTRRRIRRTAEEWSDAAGDRLQDAGDRLQGAAEEARQLADDALAVAERSGTRLRGSVERRAKKLRTRS